MGRTHTDNICWVCCCCGCLPIIGLIKGAILVGPILVTSIISFTGCAIILLPHDIFLSYKALIKTSLIGINLKIMGMLLLPIAIAFWPVLVIVGSILFGIFFGLFFPVVETFDEDCNLIYGGFYETFKETCKIVKSFWKYNYHHYFDYLREIEESDCDDPFDINIIQIIIGIILTGYGITIGTIVFTFMWLIKLFPSIFKMYYEMFRYYFKLKCIEILMYGIFFIIGVSLVPVVGVAAILAYIGFGFYGGFTCAIEGYKYNIGRGIIVIMVVIRSADSMSNELIFNSEESCFPDWSETCRTKKEKKTKIKRKKKKYQNEKNEEENNEKKPEKNNEKEPEKNIETRENEEQTEIKEENNKKEDEEQNEENKEREPEIKEDNSQENEEAENKEKLISNEE